MKAVEFEKLLQESQNFVEPFLQATLPLPPGINASYKTVNFRTKDGRMVRRPGATPALEAFKQEARVILYANKGLWDWGVIDAILDCKRKVPLAITIDLYFPTRWRRDIDGPEKAIIDAVFSYLCIDDNSIVDKHTRKLVDKDKPRCEIRVYLHEETAE